MKHSDQFCRESARNTLHLADQSSKMRSGTSPDANMFSSSCCSMAWRGVAWRGVARRGVAWCGVAGCGHAVPWLFRAVPCKYAPCRDVP